MSARGSNALSQQLRAGLGPREQRSPLKSAQSEFNYLASFTFLMIVAKLLLVASKIKAVQSSGMWVFAALRCANFHAGVV